VKLTFLLNFWRVPRLVISMCFVQLWTYFWTIPFVRFLGHSKCKKNMKIHSFLGAGKTHDRSKYSNEQNHLKRQVKGLSTSFSLVYSFVPRLLGYFIVVFSGNHRMSTKRRVSCDRRPACLAVWKILLKQICSNTLC